ncbi:MAG: uL15 family ribosomal protein [Candidatus Nitrosocaldus sp.]|nr:50S ribosomal protein L15 [Candidatus Nitrosocaldus sp.]MCS7140992.1 50S ribosomal protein L15 [Candidatus Nitrosocaldus sp.]MDW7999930.1 uL15 family ribosomal protein [Candidatus Nitrosocaldus sp.]MDW8275426.1 uL15 family ribosomal protein [Candidatus Nitrosocaldus sp.]
MVTRLRKVRKQRGSRTHGWGQIGQHRDTGKKGYRRVGLHKHKWTQAVLIEGKYFGKHGFHNPTSSRSMVRRWINIGMLDDLFLKHGRVDENGRKVIDLDSLGYDKLLGSGKVKGVYHVVVKACTESARSKVAGVGGEIITC